MADDNTMTPEEARAALKEMRDLKRDMDKAMKIFSNRIVTTKMLEILGSGKIKLRNLSSNPTSGQVGELVIVSGKLKICTATTPTWTVVGTQS